jgi:hypothetical protein
MEIYHLWNPSTYGTAAPGDQARRLLQLQESAQAQTAVTTQLRAREQAQQAARQDAEAELQLVRGFTGGDPARATLLRDAMAKIEAEEAARAIYAARRR